MKCVIYVNSICAKGNNGSLVELSSHRTPLDKLVKFMHKYIVLICYPEHKVLNLCYISLEVILSDSHLMSTHDLLDL